MLQLLRHKKLQVTKIELSAKEKKTVILHSVKRFKIFGIENKWISENGKFSIFINQLEEIYFDKKLKNIYIILTLLYREFSFSK